MKLLTPMMMLVPALACQQALALQASSEVGYDSNPHEVSSPEQGSQYTQWYVSHQGEKPLSQSRRLQYSAALDSRTYNAVESADQHRLDGRLRWTNRFKIGKRSANLMITGDWRSERQTYFSQTQGQVAETSRGDSLAERFDYDAGKLSAEFIYRFSGKSSLALYSYVAHQNYIEDYEELDLESLDYDEVNVQPAWRYKGDNGFYLRAFVYRKMRYYEGLMDDGLDGRNLDSALEYRFDGVGLLMKQSFATRWAAQLYASGYNARDNADGYRDLNFRGADVSLTYFGDGQREWSLKAGCYRRDYLNDSARPPESETGDAGRLRKGCSAALAYREPVWFKQDLYWHLQASHHQEDNSDDYLSFTRQNVSLGLTYEF